MTTPSPLREPPDFSLVLGGPLYQPYRKTHLAGPILELLWRRVLFFSLITWVPLFLLCVYGGQLLSNGRLGFLRDLETHVRFLVALPALIVAELIVHQRTRNVIKRFVEGRIVTPEEMPRFHAAIEAALRIRNSVALEFALLILVYTAGHWIWLHKVAFLGSTWYGVSNASGFHLTLAGYWNAFVSVPIFQSSVRNSVSCASVGIKDRRNLMLVESAGHRFLFCPKYCLVPRLFKLYAKQLRDVTYVTLESALSTRALPSRMNFMTPR